LVGCPVAPARADADVLWRLVHEQCVPDLVSNADPAPCVTVDLSAGPERGYAIVKDSEGPRQFLLIPTARIAGMESPALLDPATPNYFALAWRVRSFTEAAAGGALPRDWVSLAVNSAAARTQDQLHIHIDCLRADVHDTVARHADAVGPNWTPFPVPLAGENYNALAVDGEDLDSDNPFLMLAAGLPGARADMGSHTLVVVGTDRAGTGPGFLILAARADDGETPIGGEDLQDHRACPPPLPAGPVTAK
jgi:CDP-diacylglycerol pyrophosphatase